MVTPDKQIEQAALTISKQNSKNFHDNFLDLGPIYDQKRYKIAINLADDWKIKIGDELKSQMRDKFNEYINAGNKLSYEQLRELNSVWKKDYMAMVTKESDEVKEYISKTILYLQQVQDENAQ